MPPRKQPLSDRLARHTRVDPSGCWTWTGKVSKRGGYGHIGIDGRTCLVHRVAYEFWIGPIPAGLQVDHTCEQRSCVNPEHLEAVTPLVNMNRSPITFTEDGRCQKGLHDIALAGAIRLTRDGRRYCIECSRAYDREKQRRYRAAKADR